MRRLILAVLILIIGSTAGTAQYRSPVDDLVFSGSLFGGPSTPVYAGGISRKYRVIKKIRIRRRQIHGPQYHDHFNSVGWVSNAANRIGADAVINYGSRRIPGKVFILDPGFFEVWGTAVKFRGSRKKRRSKRRK